MCNSVNVCVETLEVSKGAAWKVCEINTARSKDFSLVPETPLSSQWPPATSRISAQNRTEKIEDEYGEYGHCWQ